MAEIKQILFQDDRHKFELTTSKASGMSRPFLYSSLTHHTSKDGFWIVSLAHGIKRLGTQYDRRGTRANLEALHRACLDTARHIVELCKDDVGKFEADEKEKMK